LEIEKCHLITRWTAIIQNSVRGSFGVVRGKAKILFNKEAKTDGRRKRKVRKLK
jgi:hypothetical protein